MLILHKILPTVILPVGLTLLILVTAFIFRRWAPVLAGIACLYVGSLPFISRFLLHQLESEVPELSISQADSADVILVLSGIVGPERGVDFKINWGEGYDRFDAGIRLWQAGKAPFLVLTDPVLGRREIRPTEGELLQKEAKTAGIPPEHILLLGPIVNTAEEADLFSKVAQQKAWRRAILVTSAWHMPRALERFRKTGLDLQPFPVDYRAGNAVTSVDFFPTAAALAGTETYMREWIGRFYYRMVDFFL